MKQRLCIGSVEMEIESDNSVILLVGKNTPADGDPIQNLKEFIGGLVNSVGSMVYVSPEVLEAINQKGQGDE